MVEVLEFAMASATNFAGTVALMVVAGLIAGAVAQSFKPIQILDDERKCRCEDE